MEVSKSLFERPFGARLRATALRTLGAFAIAGALLPAPTASAQRPDQVSWIDNAGRAKTWRGSIKENTLTRTVIDSGGRDRNISSDQVAGVVFGDVPPSFVDGTAYFDRGDFENAAAKFQVAASDASARDVVKAAARLRAAESWMRRSLADKSAFQSAVGQLETFLTDYPEDRQVPRARALLGRAKLLSGDFAGSAEAYRSLYGEVQAETATAGYSLEVCYDAGLAAARSTLLAGDRDAARELFGSVATALTSVLASVGESSPAHRALSATHADARLGEGFCLLAANSLSQAKTFFQGQLSSSPKTGSQRFGARLGLAETLLADGRFREAEIEFAQVSALDYTDRDRVARALVGLADCAIKLSDSNGRAQAKSWLETVLSEYADTPSVLRAQELLKDL